MSPTLLWYSPSRPLCLAPLTLFLLFKHVKLIPALEPLHVLFSSSGSSFLKLAVERRPNKSTCLPNLSLNREVGQSNDRRRSKYPLKTNKGHTGRCSLPWKLNGLQTVPQNQHNLSTQTQASLHRQLLPREDSEQGEMGQSPVPQRQLIPKVEKGRRMSRGQRRNKIVDSWLILPNPTNKISSSTCPGCWWEQGREKAELWAYIRSSENAAPSMIRVSKFLPLILGSQRGLWEPLHIKVAPYPHPHTYMRTHTQSLPHVPKLKLFLCILWKISHHHQT